MKDNLRNKKRKIPGMFYILVSFIPWIIYWTLSGMDSQIGIIAPLVFSSVLIVVQVIKKDYNLMDFTSFSYFIIAAIGAFYFNLSLFIDIRGFLGYFTLCIMALLSIVIKKPYTIQCSKKDYPMIYWKDKSFLKINSIITILWAFIFFTNAVIILFISTPFTVIFTNSLIGFGIIFSIVFPLKAPAYFASKNFKKYDWRVNICPQKEKGKNEYDVIIIGSGIGGLSCGALLVKKGYKILILEQHNQVGGYLSSFKRKDFVFNAGVIDVSGLWENGAVTYLLDQLGFKKEKFFVRNTTKYIFKGKEVIIPNKLNDTIKVLSDLFPPEKTNIKRFFEDVKLAYDECYKEADIFGVPLTDYLIVRAFGERKLLDYPREHPHFYRWMDKTFQEKLDEFFIDKDLKLMLSGLSGYTGTKPEKTSAVMALTAWMTYFVYGGYFTKGGAQSFVDTLHDFINENGGKVLTGHRVEKIIIEKNMVKGVKTGDNIYEAPFVVSNANAKTTFLELVEEKRLNKEFIEYINELKMSPSCFVVYLGVDMELLDYPTLIKNIDEGFEIAIISNSDRNLAPKGKSAVLILADSDYDDFPGRDTKEYKEKKRLFVEELVKRAEKIIPNIGKHVEVIDAATPQTMERYVLMPEGALYSFDQSIEVKRPCFKTPIKGLYLTGASTFPGGGIEGSIISGLICANDICNWKT